MKRDLLKYSLGLLLWIAAPAHAGGPLTACNGVPVKYPGAGTITLNYDQGNLDTRSKAQSDALVTEAVSLWTNVTTATVTLARGSDLPVDVTGANYLTYMGSGSDNDGLNPVIYDSDGSIIDATHGVGAKDHIGGFAVSSTNVSTCEYNEGYAVLNNGSSGRVLIAHEIGHLIGLDHSQLDNAQGLNIYNYPLMYPYARGDFSLHEDDVAAVSALYPDTSLNSVYGQLRGTFTLADGITPIRGANLWAEEISSHQVFSIVSDYLMQNTGYFNLLLPAGNYTLHAEAIQTGFFGGSRVGPYTTPTSDYSFQAPLYVGGLAMTPLTLGIGTPTLIAISAGCSATVGFKLDGSGTVSGNCGTAAMPSCTLTATPATIAAGGISTLTASCSPAATSYVWTGGTCAGTSAASCTVTPAAATTYTVKGSNSGGTGTTASATVTMLANLPAAERQVLLDLYASTNGAGWTNNTGWNGAAGTECTWYRVECDAAQSHVIQIYLRSNNLVGTLPSLNGLTALQYFEFSVNQLTGPLPSLSGLTALQGFAVGGNQLTGSIPSLSGLTALQIFSVDGNQLTGSIPSLSGLTALQWFSVQDNQLTGSIPSLSGLTALQTFYVSYNQLTGPIPSLSGLTALERFGVSRNQLTGSIPSLSGLTALRYFNVYNNQLTGPVPVAPTSLELASLCRNSLVSSGNPTTDAAWVAAQYADVTNIGVLNGGVAAGNWLACQTGGTQYGIPAAERQVLLDLYASTNGAGWTNNTGWNGATGTECTWYGISCDAGQRHVTSINLHSNNLVGILPTLSGLTALQLFYVGNNQLTGTIPLLSGLTALQYFEVSNNQLTGSIPSLNGLTVLTSFYAENNQLTGSIPSLSGLTALKHFFVTLNKLTGSIPPLSGLMSLQYFWVYQNQLTGSIPSLSGLTALQSLYANNNQLTGSIPSLSGLTALKVFGVQANQLTGSIPSLGGLTALATFNVASNQLSGSIPSLSGLTALQWFAVSGNRLTGSIPSLSGLTALTSFYAHSNQLTGAVPAAPSSLGAGKSSLYSNSLVTSGDPAIDAAWTTATGSDWLAYQTAASSTLYTLSASRTGTGSGSISSNPSGIDCGASCWADYASGTVTLTATPASGSYFYGWSGDCSGTGQCVVTMDAARNVTATFKTEPFVATTTSIITDTSATVSTQIAFNPSDVGKVGAVYITGWVPVGGLGALGIATASLNPSMLVTTTRDNPYLGGKVRSRQVELRTLLATSASNDFVLVQLTQTGWELVTDGQLIPYASGVLGDQLAAQNILNNTDTTNLQGAEFYVGYGTSAEGITSAEEMVATENIHLVATIPCDTGSSCMAESASPVLFPATDQTIGTFSFSPATLAVGATTTASATATSGLAVSFTSVTPGICTVSGSTVTGVAAGTCTLAADQAGDGSYNAAPQVTQSVTVIQAGASCSTSISPASSYVSSSSGTGDITVTASSACAWTATSNADWITVTSGGSSSGSGNGTVAYSAAAHTGTDGRTGTIIVGGQTFSVVQSPSAAAAYYDQVQRVFIAYYGRPADAAGLEYWATQLHAAGGNLNTIVDAYGNSAEAATLFGSMTSEQKIDAIYRQCFGRAADEAGRIWYAEQLTSGIMTQATIMLNVLNGASGDDATAAANKLAAANAFTAAINTTAKVQGYGGDAAAASARTFLASVTSSASSAASALASVDSTLAAIVAASGY